MKINKRRTIEKNKHFEGLGWALVLGLAWWVIIACIAVEVSG